VKIKEETKTYSWGCKFVGKGDLRISQTRLINDGSTVYYMLD
jgi:hypothetical protein